MDATIAYVPASGDPVFVPGPNIELGPGDSKVWSDVTIADLDANSVLKGYIVDGTLSVTVDDDTVDAAEALQGAAQLAALPKYAFADLPVGFDGRVAFCTNGRKTGEPATGGTGVPTYYDADTASWLVFYDDSALAI
jgi:hypothetical protein